MTQKPLFVVCSGAEHFIQPLRVRGCEVLTLGLSYDGWRKFPNSDIYTRVEDFTSLGSQGLTGRSVVILQSGSYGLSPTGEQWTTADRIFEAVQAAAAIGTPTQVKEAGHKQFDVTILPRPNHIKVFFSCFPCGLQDKVFKTGEVNSSKLVYDLLMSRGWAGVTLDQVGTVDLHAPPQLPWVREAVASRRLWLTSVADRLIESATKLFALENPLVLGPDEGSQARLGLPGFKKYRTDSFSITLDGTLDVKGRDVVVVDDLTKSGSTLLKTKEALKNQGARSVVCAVTHVTPTLAENEGLLEKLAVKLDERLIVSDSVYTKTFVEKRSAHVVSLVPEILAFAGAK